MFLRRTTSWADVAKRTSVMSLLSCSLIVSGAAQAAPQGGAHAGTKTAAKTAAKPAAKKAAANGIITNGKPKVIDIGAVWCVPCKKLAPIFEKLKTTYAGKADFQSLDVDKPNGKTMADKFGVDSVPAILIFSTNGKLAYQHSGLLKEEELTAEINKVVH